MRKTLLVGVREFRQRVTSRAFLLGAVGTPLILLVLWVFAGGFGVGTPTEPEPLELEEATREMETVGYVDHANLIEAIPEPVAADAFRAYGDVASAEAALERGEISAYYIVAADYRQTGEVERVSRRFPAAPRDVDTFDWVLVNNLYPDASQEEIRRVYRPFQGVGPSFVSTKAGEGGEPDEGEAPGMSMTPFLVAIVVMLPLFSGGSYLFQSLAQEKSSRVIEILLVSLRPRQLLTGKLLGLAALILVQYAIWVAMGGLVLRISGADVGQLLSGVRLTALEVLLIVPYALGGFGLYAALMAGIGALAPDMEGSRGWIFVLTLPMMLPIYVWVGIVNAPNGPLAVALSLFPYSAPVGMLMRMTVTAVPAWQLVLSLALLALGVAGTIWLMARLFRAQTLLSGESLSLERFWKALRAG